MNLLRKTWVSGWISGTMGGSVGAFVCCGNYWMAFVWAVIGLVASLVWDLCVREAK